jgi:hypothetical protein
MVDCLSPISFSVSEFKCQSILWIRWTVDEQSLEVEAISLLLGSETGLAIVRLDSNTSSPFCNSLLNRPVFICHSAITISVSIRIAISVTVSITVGVTIVVSIGVVIVVSVSVTIRIIVVS